MVLIIAAFALQCFLTPVYTFKWLKSIGGVKIPNLLVKMLCSSTFLLAAAGAVIYAGGFNGFSRIMFAGFLLSWLGDYLLNLTNKLLVGLGGLAFLSAHLFYIAAYSVLLSGRYSVRLFNVTDVSAWAVMIVAVILVTGLRIFKFNGVRAGVVVYGAVISFMVIKAFHLAVCSYGAGDASLLFSAFLVSGSVFFFISDFTLMFIMFAGMDSNKAHAINLFPYFFGQMLLACTMMFQV